MSNGALIMDLQSGQPIYHDDMSAESSEALRALLDSYPAEDLYYETYCGGMVYMEKRRFDEWVKHDDTPHFLTSLPRNDGSRTLELVDDLAVFCRGRKLEKINIDFNPDKPKLRIEVLTRLRTMAICNMTASLTSNLELNGPGVDKGKALTALAARLDVSMSDVVAFGDSANDTEMLEKAGYSYAMANAGEYTKNCAKYLAPPCNEAGVGHIVNRLLEIP
jgi:hydroxymethylpyrimidine pyrophosphatase-like HAD family hydrolase